MELVEIIKNARIPKMVDKATSRIICLLNSYGYMVIPVCLRSGYKILVVEKQSTKCVLWIRRKPVSETDINLARRFIPGDEFSGYIILRVSGIVGHREKDGWVEVGIR